MQTLNSLQLDPNRYFEPEPKQGNLAASLFSSIQHLPIVSPHGHVDANILLNNSFENPAQFLITSDHYVFRMLYSHGLSLEQLGVPTRDGKNVEQDPRKIWNLFCQHYYIFAGTPTALWLKYVLVEVFGIFEKPNAKNANRLYDELAIKLTTNAFSPREMFKRFKIEVLSTTDAVTDTLEAHQNLLLEGWNMVRPTFRPDQVLNLNTPDWLKNIQTLSKRSNINITDFNSFIAALEERRAFFKSLGATATDHDAFSPHTEKLEAHELNTIFNSALKKNLNTNDASRFMAHMLIEMAGMSSQDGLVMQLHVGSLRSHNRSLLARFGSDHGSDIPVSVDWTRGLRALLEEFGNHPSLRIILFTLDESTYSRELAPLAGHYPVLRLGPPWWFFDSKKGIERYLDAVLETTGVYKLAGFNDDSRNLAVIPARHDLWRRVTCNWLAGLVIRGQLDEDDAAIMAKALAYDLAKKAYGL